MFCPQRHLFCKSAGPPEQIGTVMLLHIEMYFVLFSHQVLMHSVRWSGVTLVVSHYLASGFFQVAPGILGLLASHGFASNLVNYLLGQGLLCVKNLLSQTHLSEKPVQSTGPNYYPVQCDPAQEALFSHSQLGGQITIGSGITEVKVMVPLGT